MKRPRQYIATGEPVKVYFYIFGCSYSFSHDVHVAAVITKTGSPGRRVMGQSTEAIDRIEDCRQPIGRQIKNSFDFD